MKKIVYVLLSACLILSADIASCHAQEAPQTDSFEMLYRNAVADAAYPDPSEISGNLTPISKRNPNLKWKTIEHEDYILVVSWKEDTGFYYSNFQSQEAYNTGNYEIWATVVPELQDVCTREKDSDERLKQRLGLPPDAAKNFFVEFWVRPADLFRPCPDNEITDTKCELCFPKNAYPEYKCWFNALRTASYYGCNLYQTYPWTQLGYTYDWNPSNKSHVGLSEFVIGKNINVFINKYYSTAEYCTKKQQ